MTSPSYDVFLSYSHAADASLAAALESSLKSFGRTLLERRRVTVFRDESQLSLAPDLWGTIETALTASRCFLLLASEQAARSVWVARELECWKALHGAERVFIVWTDGTLRWGGDIGDFDWSATTCVPRALAGVFRGEPLHLDLRWARDAAGREQEEGRFLRDVARIVAAIWERPVEDVYGEELRRHREMLARESTLLSERIRADHQADPERAILLALAAINNYVATPRAELALNTALDASRLRNSWAYSGHPGFVIAPDGGRVLVIGEQSSQLFDLRASSVVTEQPLPTNRVEQVLFRPDDVLVSVRNETNQQLVVDALTGQTRWTFDRTNADLVQLSDDGAMIALTRRYRGDDRGAVEIQDTATFTSRLRLTEYAQGLINVDFVPGGARLVTRSYDALTEIWDLHMGTSLARYQEPRAELVDLEISPDGSTLAVYVSGARNVRVVDAATGRDRGMLSEHGGGVVRVVFAPLAPLIVTSDRDGTVRAFDSTSLQPRWIVKGGRDTIVRAVSADDTRVLTTGSGVVSVWDTQTGERTLELRPHADRMLRAHFVLDDGAILTSSESRLRLWSARHSPAAAWDVPILEHARGSIHDMALDRAGRRLAVSHTTGVITMLDAETGAVMWQRTLAHKESLLWVTFSQDDTLLASGGERKTVRFWDPDTGEPRGYLAGHGGPVESLAFDASGGLAVTAGEFTWGLSQARDQTVSIWDVGARTLVRTLRAPKAVSRAVFSRDGSRIAASAADHHVALWDTASGSLVCFERHDQEVRGARFTLDGRLLVATAPGVVIRDGRSGAVIRRIGDPSGSPWRPSISHICVSPDNRLIAGGDSDGAYVWELESGRLLFEIPGYVSGGLSESGVQFDATGDHVIVGHQDEVSVWATASGQPTRSLPLHGFTQCVTPDAAGRFVVTADLRHVRRWNTYTGDDLARFARSRVFRELTEGERRAYGLP